VSAPATSRCRRGLVLMAVLVVSGIGLLIAGTSLLLVRAETRGAAHVAESARSRALAWSGLQAVAVELAAQRDRMIEGERPELAGQYVIEEDGPRLGVVRLLPVGPGGERLASEAAKADLARATAEELEASGMIDADLAAAIVASRDGAGGRLDSIAGLLGASDGEIGAADLHGDPEKLEWRDAIRGVEPDRAERMLDRLTPPEPRGLVDLLSVHAVEPSIDASGRPRIAISPPWSEEMDRELRDRLNDGVADGVKALLGGDSLIKQLIEGLSLEADRDLAELFVRITGQGGDPTDWIPIFDMLCFERSPLRSGRVDINLAPAAVLRMLPGVSDEEVDALVAARETLDDDERRTILWPVLREIWTPDRYPELFDRITVRSFSWRMRLACGTVDAEDPDGPIENATVWEVVVDAGEPRPRFSMIRDITQLDLAMTMAEVLPRSPETRSADRFAFESGDDAMAREVSPVGPVSEGPEAPTTAARRGAGSRPGPSSLRAEVDGAVAEGSAGGEGESGGSEAGSAGTASRRAAPIGRWRPLR
jgi:DNA uptake protein ComE-like DNA-binding protein